MIFSPHEHFDNAAVGNEHIDVRPLALPPWGRRSRAWIAPTSETPPLPRSKRRCSGTR
jgi:hypothetical protein